MEVRNYEIADTQDIIQLFYDTVHRINIQDYNQEQVNAWATGDQDKQQWVERLSNSFTFVAVEQDLIIGFSNLEINGRIDCFYCHHAWQRRGVGKRILEKIELTARELKIHRLFTEASITAKPFFASHNFIVVQQQEVERRGQKFRNFLMEKLI
ncbi:GCN5-related N-acetyltransferase [Richelia sinica FACHB-800]|uniref:GCN5-related N-acetyltransferase n=1 Tax=Richelia sinica FACHB-800 TaxID=1357546 RepID=A0A975TD95_9NOST|nr:GNAT family N-acetyltransferase [Richelia sinica]MBD2665684.1 GNAT family N-acetyltransferase [Richelia sinica FACHB-800]QXE25796.1 GCN5-related N-acetyltransferase [Richelia sinica FACHB-800]